MEGGSNNTTSIVTTLSSFSYVTEEERRSSVTIGFICIIFVIVTLVTVMGNLVVIIAVTTHRTLKHQQSNLFIINLAAADIAVAFSVMIWSTVSLVIDSGGTPDNPWYFGEGMCLVQCAMNYCLIVVSMMTLGFISVDRFVHIAYPLRYLEIITIHRIRCMIIWTWIQGLVIGFVPVGMKWIHYDYCEMVCAIDWSSHNADKFVIVAFVTCFMVPAVTMLFCYAVIFKEIGKSMKMVNIVSADSEKNSIEPFNTGGTPTKNKTTRFKQFSDSIKSTVTSTGVLPSQVSRELEVPRLRRHTNTVKESTIIKSLLVVVLVFFICMTPFSVTKLIKVLKGFVPCWVNTLATIVQLFASACNPFIYGIFRKEFRKAFKSQYNKLCHKVNQRFNSSEYSEQSFISSQGTYNEARFARRSQFHKARTASKTALTKSLSGLQPTIEESNENTDITYASSSNTTLDLTKNRSTPVQENQDNTHNIEHD